MNTEILWFVSLYKLTNLEIKIIIRKKINKYFNYMRNNMKKLRFRLFLFFNLNIRFNYINIFYLINFLI